MARVLLVSLLSVASLGTLLKGVSPQGGSTPASPQVQPGISELIRQLGSENYETREAATRQLMEQEEAAPALREALKSPDREIAKRATVILRTYKIKEEKRELAKLRQDAEAGAIDRVIARLVQRDEWCDENAAWQAIADLTGKLIALEKHRYQHVTLSDSKQAPLTNFSRYNEIFRPEFATRLPLLIDRRMKDRRLENHYVARGEDITVEHTAARSYLVSSGSIRAPGLGLCTLYAGSSVEVGMLRKSIVVCGGDVTITHTLNDSLIIARGAVRCTGPYGQGGRIIARGGFFPPEKFVYTDTKATVHEATPLGFVHFFEPAEVGVAVAAAGGGVRVVEVDKDKRFARAGLHVGDVLAAVGGTGVPSPESFRHVLLQKLVAGGAIPLKVYRDGETLEISVPDKD